MVVGANGKSTFVNTLQTILGDYAQQAQVSRHLWQKAKGQLTMTLPDSGEVAL